MRPSPTLISVVAVAVTVMAVPVVLVTVFSPKH